MRINDHPVCTCFRQGYFELIFITKYCSVKQLSAKLDTAATSRIGTNGGGHSVTMTQKYRIMTEMWDNNNSNNIPQKNSFTWRFKALQFDGRSCWMCLKFCSPSFCFAVLADFLFSGLLTFFFLSPLLSRAR